MPETVTFDFSEDDLTWVVSKLSGAAGALGSESVEMRNWPLCFGCACEEFRSVVADLAIYRGGGRGPHYIQKGVRTRTWYMR